MRRHRADRRSAAGLPQRVPVDHSADRAANVHVVERLDLSVQPDVAVTAARVDRDLALARAERGLQDRRWRHGRVEADVVLALERLPASHGGVEAARLLDPVEVGGLEVRRLVPARVPDERQPLLRRVPGDIALAVVLDHVRPGEDLVLAVGRGFARVVLLGVVLRDRGRAGHAERAAVREGEDANRLGRIDHERRGVGSLDARDVLGLS